MFDFLKKAFNVKSDVSKVPIVKSVDPKEAYDIWLSKRLDQGHTPTHFYDYNMPNNFILKDTDYYTGKFYGAESINVICLNGKELTVGGHCHAYIITNDGKAIERNATCSWIPVYADFKYVGEKTPNSQSKKHITNCLYDPYINEIFYQKKQVDDLQGILNKHEDYREDMERILSLLDERCKNFMANKFRYFYSFSKEAIQTLQSVDMLYENYLVHLMTEICRKDPSKKVNLQIILRELQCDRDFCDNDFGLHFIKNKKDIVITLAYFAN